MLFYKKETLYLLGSCWNIRIYDMEDGKFVRLNGFSSSKILFLGKIPNYSNICSLGILSKKI